MSENRMVEEQFNKTVSTLKTEHLEKSNRKIIDDYLQTQIEFIEETIKECEKESQSGFRHVWDEELIKQESKLVFLKELQRRVRNGL